MYISTEVLLSREDMMTSVHVSGLPDDLLGVHIALEEVFGSAGIIKVAISGSFSSSSVNSNGMCFELQTCHEFSKSATPVRMGFDVHVISLCHFW